MTSSSKLPAFAHGVPPPSLPTFSGSRFASSYLPGSQKEHSAASSQSVKKKKRNRGDGDVTGDGISSERSLSWLAWAVMGESWLATAVALIQGCGVLYPDGSS
ncbi:hypothetical protein LWI29_013932 [Acer saccharum]|uniref:Uncharacterized protein n=1 Tax=Acer saccharum TaxID=4024 RepID=A0AA39TKL8_ACESA|nr:hypothetical protein LWI29_013932 [Acer saccharum]